MITKKQAVKAKETNKGLLGYDAPMNAAQFNRFVREDIINGALPATEVCRQDDQTIRIWLGTGQCFTMVISES